MGLTPDELSAISNKESLLTKVAAIKKIKDHFATIRDALKERADKLTFPPTVDTDLGKISQGEFYLDLPFIVLDYPKLFTDESVFTCRTMFWWGNFFSFTLHLAGDELDKARTALTTNINNLSGTDTYLCVNDTPWEYHYEPDNYKPLDDFDDAALNEHVSDRSFIKLSRKTELSRFDKLEEFATESFGLLVGSALN